MSSPQSTRSEDAQAQQEGLAAALSEALLLLWASFDTSDLRANLPAFKAAVAVQVRRYASASATLAVRQYRAQRVAAGVDGAFTPRPASPPPVEKIAQAVDWATQPLWNANVLTATPETAQAPAVSAPASIVPEPDVAPATPDVAPPASTAIADAKARLAAAAEQQVLDTGRQTVIENVERDRKAKAWARIPEPAACSFCLMLATRGAVYHAERGDFLSHDNCRCHAEPVFNIYEPSANVRAAEALWRESTRGLSGNAARIAFRRAVEGRTAPEK